MIVLLYALPSTTGSVTLDTSCVAVSESLSAAVEDGGRIVPDVMVPEMLVALPGTAGASPVMTGEWRPARRHAALSAQCPLRL